MFPTFKLLELYKFWSASFFFCGYRYNATKMLELMRGKRMVFVGDSINRNQWESMLCMLMGAIMDPKKVYETHGRRITKEKGQYSFRFVVNLCWICSALSSILFVVGAFQYLLLKSFVGLFRITNVQLSTTWAISWFMRARQELGRSVSRLCGLTLLTVVHLDGEVLMFWFSTLHIGGPISKLKLGQFQCLRISPRVLIFVRASPSVMWCITTCVWAKEFYYMKKKKKLD